MNETRHDRVKIFVHFLLLQTFFSQNLASFVDFTEQILLSKDFSAEQKCITLIDKSYDIFGRQQGNEFELFYEFVMRMFLCL